jgi:eukaryotic-like serine/threonine-protein kinase
MSTKVTMRHRPTPSDGLTRRLGNYFLLSQLASGGMGEIHVGFHEHLERHVAIKTARCDGMDIDFLQERLLQEARALGSVNHPNVVTIYDFGLTAGGVAFLVMELLEGCSLDKIVDQGGPLPVPVAVQIVRQVAEGLTSLHAENIICADVKPDNVVVVGGPLVGLPLAKQPWIKLIDLGAACQGRAPDLACSVAGDGPLMGTSWYMSPEAVLGLPLGAYSDVYSLAVMLYELIVGRVPFVHADDAAILNMHLWQEPHLMSEATFRVTYGSKLERLIKACLSKGPLDRPGSMHEFICLLDEASDDLACETQSSDTRSIDDQAPEDQAIDDQRSDTDVVSFDLTSLLTA